MILQKETANPSVEILSERRSMASRHRWALPKEISSQAAGRPSSPGTLAGELAVFAFAVGARKKDLPIASDLRK